MVINHGNPLSISLINGLKVDFIVILGMSIRFFGIHDYAREGKFLWEILTQLRGMGVGRYVTKTEWMRKWPDELSYLKIIKAGSGLDMRNQRKGFEI